MKRSTVILLILAVFAVNFAADRVTKVIAIDTLKGQPPQSYFGNLVVLQYVENTGAFLGLGAGWPDWLKYTLLVVLPILVCLAVVVWLVLRVNNKTMIVLVSTIIAGGLGNLFDRLFNDFRVVDFLNFGIGPVRTGILNVADMSVTFGAIILLLYEIFRKKPKQNETSISSSGDDD